MIEELNELQIDNLLLSQVIGRLGCRKGKRPYIVPVHYVYDGKYIIGQTDEGKKLDMIRKNPYVCFEVDVITNMTDWESVILHGTFYELKGKASREARAYLLNHAWPLSTGHTMHPHEHEANEKINANHLIKSIMYRIKIKEKSGRSGKII
ncbi:MAG: pyridoxamine 5'-phosphate oxidase family protein [Ginsengibacter sp.]